MKYLILIISILIFLTGKVLSGEIMDCKNFKKFSMQYTWCKSKNLGTSVKNKVVDFKKNKNNENKKN